MTTVLKKVCFRVLRFPGVFLARLIVTWIHFLVNELQECESIESMCLKVISVFVK